MGYERYNRGQRDPRDSYGEDRNRYGGGERWSSERGFDSRPADYYDRVDWNDRGGSQQRDQGRFGGYGDYSYNQGRDRFNDVEDYGRQYRRDYGRQNFGGQNFGGQGYGSQNYGNRDFGNQGYGRQPQGYDYQDRGFLDRSVDEVRSWFGDDEAERRREADARYDQRFDRERDSDYGSWRSGQIASFDRDYDEYRRENRSKFENEFSNWRTERQGQRNSLNSVTEHMEVIGSDGSHVGTVDKVRGDRIVLTKNDQDADGRHHSIPSRWIDQVSDKVTLRKTADEAQSEWRDEERNQAFFGEDRDRGFGRDTQRRGGMLDRSFSGTY